MHPSSQKLLLSARTAVRQWTTPDLHRWHDTAAQEQIVFGDTLKWLDEHVKNEAPQIIPTFRWFDQKGNTFTSPKFPFEAGFNDPANPILASGGGGVLLIAPIIGGSGPQTKATTSMGESIPLLVSPAFPSAARNALNTTVTAPDNGTTYIAGAAELSFTYSGIGTGRFIYAQLVDDQAPDGRVVGNLVTPVPVTLDGKTRDVTIDMSNVVYTAEPGDTLTLQITSSSTAYEKFGSFGVINVSDVQLSVPTVNPVNVTQE